MPDDFDSIYKDAIAQKPTQAPPVADDFDSVYKDALAQVPTTPNTPPKLTQTPEQFKQGKAVADAVEDIYHGAIAGFAKLDDTADIISRNMNVNDALGIPDAPKRAQTSLQELQAMPPSPELGNIGGMPHNKLLYDISSTAPYALMAPELLPIKGVAGYATNVVGMNALIGGVQEAGEQASQGKQLDPKEIGMQAALSAVGGVAFHEFGQRVLKPVAKTAGKWLKDTFFTDSTIPHKLPEAELPGYAEQLAQEGSEEASEDAWQKYGEAPYAAAKTKMLHGGVSQYAEEQAATEELDQAWEKYQVSKDRDNQATASAKKALDYFDNEPPGGTAGGDSGGTGGGGSALPPDEVPTVREEAVELRSPHKQLSQTERQLITDKLKPMMQKKYEADQAEHNFRETFQKLENLRGKMSKRKHQVLTPEEEAELRDMAAEWAGLKPDQLKRNPDASEISTIRQTDDKSVPLRKYNPQGNSLSTLVGEAKFWRQRMNQHQAEYEALRDAAGITSILQPHESMELTHGGRRFIVKHSRQPRRETSGPFKNFGIIPQGTPEQNAAYKEFLTAAREEAMAAKGALNQELEPSMAELAQNLEATGDSQLAAVVKGRKAIEADDRIVEAAAKEGVLPQWAQMIADLIEDDKGMSKVLGTGMILAGQVVGGQRAEAADGSEGRGSDAAAVGTGLTAMGAGLLGIKAASKSPAIRKGFNMAAHVITAIPDATLFKGLQGAMKAAKQRGINIPSLIHRVGITQSNLQILKSAEPALAAELERLRAERAVIVGGEGTIPETPQALQAWLEGPQMSPDELAANPHLNPIQKAKVAQLRNNMLKGAAVIQNELDRRAAAGIKNKRVDDTLHCEAGLNWDVSGRYRQRDRNNILTFMARGGVNAAQQGNLKLHAYHLLEMYYSVPAYSGLGNFATAQKLMATGNKGAKKFTDAMNVRLPVHANFEDTATDFTDKMAVLGEKIAEKTGLAPVLRSKGAIATSKAISGQLTEKVKMDTALLAFSEKAAEDMGYSSGDALRNDLTHFLNGEAHKTSSEFTPGKGLEAIGRIMEPLDATVGGSPSGFKVALCVDRLRFKNPIFANLMPFTRTRIIAARARANMLTRAGEQIEAGDFDGARSSVGAAMIMSGISVMWLGGSAIDKEFQLHMLQNDPVNAKKYHDTMQRFALLGRAPGAVGEALNAVGVKNDLAKHNFVAPHTQPAMFWPAHVGDTMIGQAIESGKTLGSAKKSPAQKIQAGIALAAQAGVIGIPGTMSFEVMARLGKYGADAAAQGGNIEYTYTPQTLPFGLDSYLNDQGNKMQIGPVTSEHPHYINSHFTEQTPTEAVLTHYLTPGESMNSEEHHFNDMVEYYSEANIKTRYGEAAHKALKEAYKEMLPISAEYEKIRRKMGRHTASEEETKAYQDVKARYHNIEKEMDRVFEAPWGEHVRAKNFWVKVLEHAQSNPEWLKQVAK